MNLKMTIGQKVSRFCRILSNSTYPQQQKSLLNILPKLKFSMVIFFLFFLFIKSSFAAWDFGDPTPVKFEKINGGYWLQIKWGHRSEAERYHVVITYPAWTLLAPVDVYLGHYDYKKILGVPVWSDYYVTSDDEHYELTIPCPQINTRVTTKYIDNETEPETDYLTVKVTAAYKQTLGSDWTDLETIKRRFFYLEGNPRMPSKTMVFCNQNAEDGYYKNTIWLGGDVKFGTYEWTNPTTNPPDLANHSPVTRPEWRQIFWYDLTNNTTDFTAKANAIINCDIHSYQDVNAKCGWAGCSECDTCGWFYNLYDNDYKVRLFWLLYKNPWCLSNGFNSSQGVFAITVPKLTLNQGFPLDYYLADDRNLNPQCTAPGTFFQLPTASDLWTVLNSPAIPSSIKTLTPDMRWECLTKDNSNDMSSHITLDNSTSVPMQKVCYTDVCYSPARDEKGYPYRDYQCTISVPFEIDKDFLINNLSLITAAFQQTNGEDLVEADFSSKSCDVTLIVRVHAQISIEQTPCQVFVGCNGENEVPPVKKINNTTQFRPDEGATYKWYPTPIDATKPLFDDYNIYNPNVLFANVDYSDGTQVSTPTRVYLLEYHSYIPNPTNPVTARPTVSGNMYCYDLYHNHHTTCHTANCNPCARLSSDSTKQESSLNNNLDKSNEFDFIIIPNPGNGNFDIVYNSLGNHVTEVYIFDIAGRMIWKENNSNSDRLHHIELNDVSKGVYFVIAKSQNGELKTKKLVVD